MYKRSKGFTLIEIMVVIVIIGILASVLVPRLIERPEQARIIKAKQDILTLENALELYKLDNGHYPSNEQSLKALVKKPTTPPIPQNWKSEGYIKKLQNDPWGNPYQYSNPGKHGEIDIYTNGPTDKKGGEDANQVIGNWQ